jgi:hypothetical protein
MVYPSDCGHFDYLVERTARVVAANTDRMSPRAIARILGKPVPTPYHPGAAVPTTAVAAPASMPGIQPPIFKTVVRAACDAFETNPRAILRQDRSQSKAVVRFACFRLLTEYYGWSVMLISRLFERDHSTVGHGVERASDLYATNADWRRRYEMALAVCREKVGRV